MSSISYHRPVMLSECMEKLQLDKGNIFIDLTFGGGGHTQEMLRRLPPYARIIAFDRDRDVVKNITKINDARLTFIQSDFRYLGKYMKIYRCPKADGILADLGVSSHQLNKVERGFSFRYNAPLDMRMNCQQQTTAQALLQEATERELLDIFRNYGEVKNAWKITEAILRVRGRKSIQTSRDIVQLLEPFTPREKKNKYLAKVFQALRIAVNEELTALQEMLMQTKEVLNPKARLVVMSYHSLEDRLVKNFLKTGNFSGTPEKDFYGKTIRPFQPITRKPVVASKQEIAANNRARSAKLRVGELISF